MSCRYCSSARPSRRLLGRVTNFLSVTLLAQLALQQIQPVTALFGIGEQRFKYEGLIDIGSLGLNNAEGMVAALGDLDGGQL
jgi:hypothetical protein